jgi:hypothetical protein
MFVLAAVSASATAGFAFDGVTVNVPFNFETHGKTFPAGTYTVESASNHCALKLSSNTDTNTKVSFTWGAFPTEFAPNMSTLSLRFDIGADGTHALRTIRLGTLITPVLDIRERHVPQHEVSISEGH